MAERKKVTPLQGVRAVSTPAARAIDIHAAPTQTGLEDVVSSLKSLNPKLMDYGVAKQQQIDKEALAQINYLAQEFKNDNKGGMVTAAKIGQAYPQHSPIINGKIAEILGGQHAETMVRSKMQELFANAKIRQDGNLRGGFYKDVIDEIHAETKDRPFYSAGAIAKAETLIKQYEANFVQEEAGAKHQIQKDGFNATIDSILTNSEIPGKAEEIEIQFQNYAKTSSLTNEEMKNQIVETIIDRGIMSYANQELSEAVIGVFTDDGELIGGSLPEKFRNDPEVLEKLFQASEDANKLRVNNDALQIKKDKEQRVIDIRFHTNTIMAAQLEANSNNTNATITADGKEYSVMEYLQQVVPRDILADVTSNAQKNASVDLDVSESVSSNARAQIVSHLFTSAMLGNDLNNIPDDATWKEDFIAHFPDESVPFTRLNFARFIDETSTLRLADKQSLQNNLEKLFNDADIAKTSVNFQTNSTTVANWGLQINAMGNLNKATQQLEALAGRPMAIPAILEEFHSSYFRGLLQQWSADPNNKGRPDSEQLEMMANKALDRTRQEFNEWTSFVTQLGAGERPDLNNTDAGLPVGQVIMPAPGQKDNLGRPIREENIVVVGSGEDYDFQVDNTFFKYEKKTEIDPQNQVNPAPGDKPLKKFERMLMDTDTEYKGVGNTTRSETVITNLNLGDRANDIAQRWLNLRKNDPTKEGEKIWNEIFVELGIDPNNQQDANLRSALKSSKEILDLLKKDD
tara:strand:+ start:2253 stop:4484 length:2232 start_codon:yes stop_codon:yes gene_type:complete